VLSRDPYESSIRSLREIIAVKTIIEGKMVS